MHNKEHMNILYVVDGNAPFESVNLLQNSIHNSLVKRVNLTECISGAQNEEQYNKILDNQDLIVGLDTILLKTRRLGNFAIPLILPSYGLGTRGLLPLWEHRELLQEGDVFICPSGADLLAASSHFKNKQISLHLVPYCIPQSYFDQEETYERKTVLQGLGINDEVDQRWLLYSGRLNQQKNIHLLFNMVKELVRLGDNVHLLIAGSEDKSGFPELYWDNSGYTDYLQQNLRSLGLTHQVHFIGSVKPELMKALYNIADVNVTCSTFRTEDFGFAPIEAMAMGTPTVGTAWGGFWDTIKDGVTGFRFPVYMTEGGLRPDWMAGVQFIHQLLNDENLRSRLSESGKHTARVKYHPDVFTKHLLDVFENVIKSKKTNPQPIDLSTLLDTETLEFFNELAGRINNGYTLLKAREGLFKNPGLPRVHAFWKAYHGDAQAEWQTQDIPYIPLQTVIEDGYAEVSDRNWPSRVSLTPKEERLLKAIDAKKPLGELAQIASLQSSDIVDMAHELTERGLIIPFQKPTSK